jgi:hypothetical protein
MSLDLAIACAFRPPPPTAYGLRVAGFAAAWKPTRVGDARTWEGSIESYSVSGCEPNAVDAVTRAALVGALGAEPVYVLVLNGRASDEDGWELVTTLGEEIALDTLGVYLSLDDGEVFHRGTRELRDESARVAGDILARLDDAMHVASAGRSPPLVELVGEAMNHAYERRTLAGALVVERVLDRMRMTTITEELAVLAEGLLATRGQLFARAIDEALDDARARLGASAPEALVRDVGERAHREIEWEASRWANDTPPSHADADSICTRALADVPWDACVLLAWASKYGVRWDGVVPLATSADLEERRRLIERFGEAVRRAPALSPFTFDVAKRLLGTDAVASSSLADALRRAFPERFAMEERSARQDALAAARKQAETARFGHDPSKDFF